MQTIVISTLAAFILDIYAVDFVEKTQLLISGAKQLFRRR